MAPGLDLTFRVGRRPALGWLLRLVPSRLATAPWWARLTDPVARVVLRGVRTRGTAGNERREYYGATDLHRITELAGSWQGNDLGGLAPVSPEPGFGFGSTPRASVGHLDRDDHRRGLTAMTCPMATNSCDVVVVGLGPGR